MLDEAGIECDGIDTVHLTHLDPKEHSYSFAHDNASKFMVGERAIMCFTFDGFEDIFTGFILIVPETEASHEKPEPNSYWMTAINQYGFPFVPQELFQIGVSFNEGLSPEAFDAEIDKMVSANRHLFMQIVSLAARGLISSGRQGYIERTNELLALNGKPPMVVL